MNTSRIAALNAEINRTPVRDQAALRALYAQLSAAYAEALRPTVSR